MKSDFKSYVSLVREVSKKEKVIINMETLEILAPPICAVLLTPMQAMMIILGQQPNRNLNTLSEYTVGSLSDFIFTSTWKRRAIRAWYYRAVNDVLVLQGTSVLHKCTRSALGNFGVVVGAGFLVVTVILGHFFRSCHTLLALDLSDGYPTGLVGLCTAFHASQTLKWQKAMREVVSDVKRRDTVFRPSRASLILRGVFTGTANNIKQTIAPRLLSHPLLCRAFAKLCRQGSKHFPILRSVADFIERRSKWLRIAAFVCITASLYPNQVALERTFYESSLYTVEALPLVATSEADKLRLRGCRELRLLADVIPTVVGILLESDAVSSDEQDRI